MGDSGSQAIGFTLAALGLVASWKVAGTTVATLLLPMLILAIPILDTALVTVVRLLEGRPIYQGGRDHTSHRLVYRGLSERRALVLLAVISAGLGATSLAYTCSTTRGSPSSACSSRSRCSCSSRASSPTSSGRRSSARVAQPARRSTAARLIEVLVDFALIAAAFTIAFLLRVDGAGTTTSSTSSGRAPGHPRRALPRLHPGRALQRRLALRRARARPPPSSLAVVVSEGLAYGVRRHDAVRSATSRATIFVLDALIA